MYVSCLVVDFSFFFFSAFSAAVPTILTRKLEPSLWVKHDLLAATTAEAVVAMGRVACSFRISMVKVKVMACGRASQDAVVPVQVATH